MIHFDDQKYEITTHALEQMTKRFALEINREDLREIVVLGQLILDTQTHRYIQSHTSLGVLRFPCKKDQNEWIVKSVLTQNMKMNPI